MASYGINPHELAILTSPQDQAAHEKRKKMGIDNQGFTERWPGLNSKEKTLFLALETPQEIGHKIKSIKPYLADEFGVDQIGYFGSFANGDYHQHSDIDVLVTFNRKIGWKFFDLKDFLESVLDRKVDLVTERSLRKQWKQAILQQIRYI